MFEEFLVKLLVELIFSIARSTLVPAVRWTWKKLLRRD